MEGSGSDVLANVVCERECVTVSMCVFCHNATTSLWCVKCKEMSAGISNFEIP